MNNTDARNMGHGHVTPRPDGYRSRCGGPVICVVCQAERAAFEAAAQQPQDERGQGLSMDMMQAIYAKAWSRAADWANRHDLHSDVGSPAYLKDMAIELAEFADAATPAQPVALSTLTDDEIEQFIYERCKRFLTADMIPAIRALAASAPAQQATPPQPVAAEVAIAPKLLLERAAEMCEWYAEFIRENVMSVDIERHPYRPELEGIAEDLRAFSGTGSDESKKGEA